MSEGNVVFLQFKSPHVAAEDVMTIHACNDCKNKTFTLTQKTSDQFPMMRCAACGLNIGRMGWARDDDPALKPPDPA